MGSGAEIVLDVTQSEELMAYLTRNGLASAHDPLSVVVLPGGVSCHTVLVRGTRAGNVVVKQALPKLRVAVEWLSDPKRIHREALGMRYLKSFCPAGSITELLHEDHEEHLIAMSEVREPYRNWKETLLAGEVAPDHVRQFAMLLAAIHRGSSVKSKEVAPVFEDRTFFETLRVEPYYRYSAQQAPECAAFLAELIVETLNTRLSIVHGDFSPKNILVSHGQLVLLDHEVIHFGDPAFDLGFSLTHLLSKAHHLRSHRRTFLEAALEYVTQYVNGISEVDWKEKFEPRAVRHTLACLLARGVGRSPLEYLCAEDRIRQRRIVAEMMQKPDSNLKEMIKNFQERLGCQ